MAAWCQTESPALKAEDYIRFIHKAGTASRLGSNYMQGVKGKADNVRGQTVCERQTLCEPVRSSAALHDYKTAIVMARLASYAGSGE